MVAARTQHLPGSSADYALSVVDDGDRKLTGYRAALDAGHLRVVVAGQASELNQRQPRGQPCPPYLAAEVAGGVARVIAHGTSPDTLGGHED